MGRDRGRKKKTIKIITGGSPEHKQLISTVAME